MYNDDKYKKSGNQAPELLKQVLKNEELTIEDFVIKAANREF